MQQLTCITPTLCRLMGIELPEISTKEVIADLIEESVKLLNGRKIDKCLVYAPDAIGEALFQDYSNDFRKVMEIAPSQVVLRSVFPSVTPVVFGSMFTGALPEAHGITQYDKPVLECDTIFDALLRSLKKVAIVAVEGSSIAKIFLNRDLDYFIEEYDGQVNERVAKLIGEDDHDFILAYNQEYDDVMHRTVPRSPEAITAMRNHIRDFTRLGDEFLKKHRDETRLVLFSPDHGTHVDAQTGRGAHGLDIPEDMEVRSFWGIYDKT